MLSNYQGCSVFVSEETAIFLVALRTIRIAEVEGLQHKEAVRKMED
jgi:hypothetical protein